MQKFAVILSYKGTRYCGWQTQTGSGAAKDPSIQSTIQAALAQMTGEDTSIVASGRTDSGVHAVRQVAHFVLKKKEWPTRILHRGLNTILPNDIRIRKVIPVSMEFHAQRSALRKQYSYYFQQGTSPLPHLEPYSWFIHKALDQQAMNEAVAHLIGEHDFKAFQASGSKPTTTSVRTILEAEVREVPAGFPADDQFGREVTFMRARLMGTGFLKQMVRGIAGTLLQIGEGRRPPEDMKKLLEARSRTGVGPTAPARGLWLEKVWYPPEFEAEFGADLA
jgi:tRNA pseudouridine38-40 synthase